MGDISKYLEVKEQMKTGDLLQWHSNSLIGAAIRWKTSSDINHSGLVLRLSEYEGLERRRWTSEALEHGVYPILLSRRLREFNGHVWWYPLVDDWNVQRQAIGERMLAYLGTSYDYSSLFRQIFGKVSADARDLFCSEYCYICYGYSGTAPQPGEMLKLGIFKEGVQLM